MMSVWDNVDAARMVSEAFERRDATEVRRLLAKHPECLRRNDDIEHWLHLSACYGWVDFVSLFVELGIGINESDNPEDPDSSALRGAADRGRIAVVSWLIDNGAQINFGTGRDISCRSVRAAVRNGHLDIVRLLVQHGADVHAVGNGVNCLMDAEFYGRTEVAEYLRSLGCKDVRQITPPDYPASHKRLLANMVMRERGGLSRWQWMTESNPPVAIRRIDFRGDEDRSACQILFTVGLSDHRMDDGHDPFFCVELKMVLPSDWPIEDRADPDHPWPIEWMERIVVELQRTERLAVEWLFMNGDPPLPLSNTTQLAGWIGLSDSSTYSQMPDWRWVSQVDLHPIYVEEAELLRKLGDDELAQRLADRNVLMCIDPRRPNVAL